MAKSKDPLENIVKVISSATCLSLSGKSNITYQVGTDPDSNIYLRIYGNTGDVGPILRQLGPRLSPYLTLVPF
jgi:hypothetical protein